MSPDLLRQAARGMRRTPQLTLLMIAALAQGVAVWVTATGSAAAYRDEPLRRSQDLYRVELWYPSPLPALLRHSFDELIGELPTSLLSPREAAALARSGIPSATALTTSAELPAGPEGRASTLIRARFATASLFAMFELPFARGGAWETEADAGRSVVLEEATRRAWFGDREAVGETIRVAGESYRVVGVLEIDASVGRDYSYAGNRAALDLWLPFAELDRLGATPLLRYPKRAGESPEERAVHLWVRLPDAPSQAAYASFLREAAAGLEARDVRPRLRSYARWRADHGIPAPYLLFELLSLATLAACSLSLMRLLSTKFAARSSEVALRRALGARRRTIFLEHLVEAELVAALGAVLGVLLGTGGLGLMRAVIPDQPVLFDLRLSRAVLGLGVGLVTGLVSGLIPAWRACRGTPARFLGAWR